MKKQILKGWIFACITAFLWAIYAITMKLGINLFDNIHPVTFILQSYIISALVLLIAAGAGNLSVETLRNPYTWLYGTLQILNNIFLMTAFVFAISATSATLLLRFGIIISVVLSIMQGKKETKNIAGICCIILGLIAVCSGLNVEHKAVAIFLVFLSALSQVLQVKISEKHKQNNIATGSIKSELRVTGYVVAISASFYALLIGLSVLIGFDKYLTGIVPSVNEFLSINSLVLALFTGIFVISGMKYFMFYSTKTIGSSNFLVVVAFTPLLTIIIEKTLNIFDFSVYSNISNYDLLGCFLIILGALLNIKTALYFKNKKQKLSPKKISELNVLRETIMTTKIAFNDDMDLVASKLGVGKRTIQNILTTEKEVSKTIKNKIIFGHAENVAGIDHLTGALNKISFDIKLQQLENIEKAMLLFIDLDKFKPVNDTYGHDVGDAILKGIAERLMDEFNQPHLVARLGGDEYCVLVYGADKAEADKYKKSIKSLVKASFIVEGIADEIEVGCSTGSAHYPTDTKNRLELKSIADKDMYKHKESKLRAQKRKKYLQDIGILDNSKLKVILNKDLRNTVIHLYENLDDLVFNNNIKQENISRIYRICIGSKFEEADNIYQKDKRFKLYRCKMFSNGLVLPIKVYNYIDCTYYNLNSKLNIQDLLNDVQFLIRKIKEITPPDKA